MCEHIPCDFLRFLWRGATKGTLAIHQLPSSKTYFSDLSRRENMNDIERIFPTFPEDQNLYHTIGLLKARPKTGRGVSSDVIGIPGFWMDIDVKSPFNKGERLPDTVPTALNFLSSLKLPPSMIVGTGYGLHSYWLFERIWYFDDDSDRSEAAQLSDGFQNHLIAMGREQGWQFDKTSDLVRILRLPGTYNFKDPEGAKEVTIVKVAPSRVTLDAVRAVAIPNFSKRTWGKGMEPVQQGERNTTLFKYALRLLRKGLAQDEAWPLLKQAAGNCKPPLPESEVKQILKSAVRYSSTQKDKDTRIPSAHLADLIKGRMALIHDGNDFFRYNGKGLWVKLHNNEIAKEMKDQLGIHATNSRIADAMKLLEADVYKKPQQLLNPPGLINLLNGMLNVKEMKLLPHKPEYYSRTQVPIEYRPDSKADRFLKFLSEVFADAPSKILTVQDFAGYILYPEIFIHKCLFLVGTGANGKSVLVNTLAKLVGEENVSTLDLHQLSTKFMITTLKDKLLNIATEMQATTPVDEVAFKKAIAGDWIMADEKFKDPIKFRPIAKHIFSMNEPPTITDRTHALRRRLIVIRLNRVFSSGNEDKFLEKKLATELTGILNWAAEGLQRVLRNQAITTSPEVEQDQSDFLRAIDHLHAFVEECCIIGEKQEWARSELYKKYTEWVEENGLRRVSKPKFYRYLEANYPIVLNTYGQSTYRGIGLQTGGF